MGNRKDTYLVTGGAGFIGSNFIRYMLAKHDDIRILNVDALTYAGNIANLDDVANDHRYVFRKADIRDSAAMDSLFAEFSPDYVVNFAAESHVDNSIKNPMIFVETNVLGTVNLLSTATRYWVDGNGDFGKHRYLQVSTDEVYGSLSLDEPDTFFTEDTPLSPHSPYSASKASADLFVRAWHDTYGFPALITRCSNNYGPYQFPEKLIPLMIDHALEHDSLPVYGDGKNIRDWLYVADHCKAIDMVLSNGRLGEVYNIGGHNERSNVQIVKRIIDRCAEVSDDPAITADLIEYVEDRKGHDRRYGISPKKIGSELGWSPETMFDDGIEMTIDWYLDNKRWLADIKDGTYSSRNEEFGV